MWILCQMMYSITLTHQLTFSFNFMNKVLWEILITSNSCVILNHALRYIVNQKSERINFCSVFKYVFFSFLHFFSFNYLLIYLLIKTYFLIKIRFYWLLLYIFFFLFNETLHDWKTRLKITQLENVHFNKVIELKLTQEELHSIFKNEYFLRVYNAETRLR